MGTGGVCTHRSTYQHDRATTSWQGGINTSTLNDNSISVFISLRIIGSQISELRKLSKQLCKLCKASRSDTLWPVWWQEVGRWGTLGQRAESGWLQQDLTSLNLGPQLVETFGTCPRGTIHVPYHHTCSPTDRIFYHAPEWHHADRLYQIDELGNLHS